MRDSTLLSALARCFVAGEPVVAQIVARTRRTLGKPRRWLQPLAERYVETFAGQTRPRHRDVVQFLMSDPHLARARTLAVKHWLTAPQQMQPVAAAASWDVPAIESAGDLADWLGLYPGELEWFADLKALG